MANKINIRNINSAAIKAEETITELAQKFGDLKSDIIRVANESEGDQDGWWIPQNEKDNESTVTFAFKTGDNRKPITALSVKKQKEILLDDYESADFKIFAGRMLKLKSFKLGKLAAETELAGFVIIQDEHAKAIAAAKAKK